MWMMFEKVKAKLSNQLEWQKNTQQIFCKVSKKLSKLDFSIYSPVVKSS